MRRARVLAVGLALALALAGLALWGLAARRSLAERAAETLARRAGLEASELHVRELGWRGAELGPVALGPPGALRAESVVVSWTWASLWAGRLAALELEGVRARLAWGEDGLRVAGLEPAAPAEAGEPADGAPPPALPVRRIRIRDAWLELEGPAGPLLLEGLDAGAELGPDGTTLLGARAELAALRDGGGEARFPPVRVRLETGGGDQTLPLSGTAEALDRRVRVAFEAAIVPADASASAELTLAPVTLGAGGLGLDDLSPWLPDLALESISGRVSGRASVRAGADGAPSARGELVLDAVGAVQRDGTRLEGLAGRVLWAGPAPFRTRGVQEVRFAVVDLIGPFTDGRVRFEASWPIADVERATWSWAGGTVSTGGRFDLTADEHTFTLAIEDLDLAALLADAEVEGLSGQGRLSGSVPLVYRDASLRARGGELHATAPGILRYRPAGDAARALGLAGDAAAVVGALEEYHYEELRLTLDGALDADMKIGAHLEGRNPSFQEGRPVVLNLNLEANLPALLGGALVGERVRDVLEKRLGDRVVPEGD